MTETATVETTATETLESMLLGVKAEARQEANAQWGDRVQAYQSRIRGAVEVIRDWHKDETLTLEQANELLGVLGEDEITLVRTVEVTVSVTLTFDPGESVMDDDEVEQYVYDNLEVVANDSMLTVDDHDMNVESVEAQ